MSLRSGAMVCQGEMPNNPMVSKCLHVTNLTYMFRDEACNEYQLYHHANKARGSSQSEQNNACANFGNAMDFNSVPLASKIQLDHLKELSHVKNRDADPLLKLAHLPGLHKRITFYRKEL